MPEKLLLFFSCTLFSLAAVSQEQPWDLRSGDLVAGIASEGLISLQEVNAGQFIWPVKICTTVDGCETRGEVISTKLSDGGIEYKRLLKDNRSGMSCYLTEKFKPSGNSIRCEIEIHGTGDPWSALIITRAYYTAGSESRIWLPWGDPRVSDGTASKDDITDPEKSHDLRSWADPLTPAEFFSDTLYYGAPYFTYQKPGIGFIPFQRNLFCIPMVSILEDKADRGLSIILDPDDDILDLTMGVGKDGTISFNRLFNRISEKNILKFSFDIITHESDWRGGLRWMSNTYPEYFNPANPAADVMAGTGGYSDSDVDFDVVKMKKMAFSVNWRASFDFPYMGMFIPPVEKNETWMRFGGQPTSVELMESYAAKMKDLGFHVLSYFNVTEFGARMKYPPDTVKIKNDSDLWKSANDFLSVRLGGALVHVPLRVPQESLGFYAKTRQGGAYFTWEDGVILDCGESVYKDFLLDQAQKHITLIPSSDGICIDRLDWLRMYNEERDDGITWFIDRPARSLLTSWKNLMKELSPLMHENNKVIFVNNHDKRLDLLKNIDGIFDEFTYAGVPLNLTAFLCINKTALGWTADNSPIKSEGADNFFQKYLYLGVYPMAPFPGNDHSIRPDEWTDKQYLDYGPMLSLMKSKKWVLEPHCIGVEDNAAKVNLFKVSDGYVLPVVFGRQEQEVIVMVRNIPGLEDVICKAAYPGSDEMKLLESRLDSGVLQIHVPLVRSCAMVKIFNVK